MKVFLDMNSEERSIVLSQSIGQRFIETAKRLTARKALVCNDSSISYGELLSNCLKVAGRLHELGAATGDRVVITLSDPIEIVCCIFACLLKGVIYVPIDSSTESFVTAVIDDCQPFLTVSDNENLLAKGAMSFDYLMKGLALDKEDVCKDPLSSASILYTSGSTGTPKGVLQIQRNVLFHVKYLSDTYKIDWFDVHSVVSGFHFDGSTTDLYCALLNGCTLVACNAEPRDFTEISEVFERERVSLFHSTPTFFRMLCGHAKSKSLKNVRLAILGGEAVRSSDYELACNHFAEDCVFVNGYGATETSGFTALFEVPEAEDCGEVLPIGFPPPGVTLSIRDENGKDAKVGELFVQSEYISLGYWNNKSLTDAAFGFSETQSYYRTGDLVEVLENGALFLRGRKDRQVKIGGYRVDPSYVEAVLNRHLDIEEAVIKPIINEVTGFTELHMFVAGTSPDLSELKSWSKGKLPGYMFPSSLNVLSSFPLTRTGKVDLKVIFPKKKVRFSRRKNEKVDVIRNIWSDILSISDFDYDTGFFQLGGNSLSMLKLATEYEVKFNVKVTLIALFGEPTVNGHRKLIEGAVGSCISDRFKKRIIKRRSIFFS